MKNYGLQHDVIQLEDYVLGSAQRLSGGILQSDGDWSDALPVYEPQLLWGVETMSCATFATLNCLEAILYVKYGEAINQSDRYNAIMSGTTRSGNSPQKVIQSIRNDAGTIPQEMLPFSMDVLSFDDFHNPHVISEKMRKTGKDWLENYKIGHEWVFNSGSGEEKCEKIMEALLYSPVGVSVKAWRKEGEYYVKGNTERDNHWVMAFRGVSGEYIEIYDQYENKFKKLKWGYNFNMAKRYSVDKILQDEKTYWFVDLWNSLLAYFKDLSWI